jgi:hypothetical protein
MKKTYLLASAVFLLFGFSQTAYSAPLVYIDFDGDGAAETNWTINAGDPFTANIYASNFADTMGNTHNGLIGFGLNLTFDPAEVTADSVSVAAPWNTLANTVSPGSASVAGLYFAIGLIPGLPTTPPLLLGSVHFSGSQPGLIDLALADRPIAEFGGKDGFIFDQLITFQGATVTAASAAVPLPGAVWLLGAGLTSLFGLRSRGKKTA